MKRFNTLCISLLFIMGFALQSFAQISHGGTPPSFIDGSVADNIEVINLEKPDMEQIMIEDEMNVNDNLRPRAGVSVTVNKGIENSGIWTELENGGRLWQLSLHCPDAQGLGVYFDDFQLPDGGELYLYNENKKQVLGAFTKSNNKETGLFATQLVQGDIVTLEYYQPAWVTEAAVMNISEIAYNYRFFDFLFPEEDGSRSWWCMINVNCEEGDDWQDEKHGVVKQYMKIGFYYYLCSGSLVNTTTWDRDPYVLTAAHCGFGATTNDLNTWIFYFNYEAATCNGTYGPQNQTVTGCELKAWDHFTSIENIDDSDFYLVLLNSSVPASYSPYYNGWDRRDVPGEEGVGIHHPDGDIKKISTYDYMVSSTWWTGKPSHWQLWWIETVNGKSIMQGGSSGSPIFNQDKRVIGDLTGGYTSNSCESPSPAFYGKFYWSWDKAGSGPAFRLKPWLDHANTGDTVTDGIPGTPIPPEADFEADVTNIMQGEQVQFTDLSGNKPQSWEWSFPGGEPETSNEKNPVVIYADTGYHDVTLYIENPDGNDELTMENYIYVGSVAPPVTDFEADTTQIAPFQTVNFFDLTANDPIAWQWIFEGGTPNTSDEQNPESIKYYSSGLYDVTLIATNGGGDDTLTKENYINVVWVGVDENNLPQNVKLYPNPTTGHLILEVTNIEFEKLNIEVYNSVGGLVYEEQKDNAGKYLLNLNDQPEGIYFVTLRVNDMKTVQRVSLIR